MPHHDTSAMETVALLDDLARACRADERGFRAAADLVERREFAELLVQLAERRAECVEELEESIHDLGGEPAAATASDEPDHGWLDHEDVESGEDESILDACEWNEGETIARFREALGTAHLPDELRDALEEWTAELEETRGRLQGLEIVAENGSGT